jgi:hypothetical protein
MSVRYAILLLCTVALNMLTGPGLGPLAQAEPAQTVESNACLTPSPSDYSSKSVPPAASDEAVPGNMPPPVRDGKAAYQSDMPASFALHMELVFKIRNQDQFMKCLDSINNPSSAYYRQFLNATSLQPYLPNVGEKSSVASYLTNHGFQVTFGPSPLVLRLGASVQTVENTFNIHVGVYRIGKNGFYAADSDPMLPRNYAALTSSILGLENYTTVRPSLAAPGSCVSAYCPQGLQVGYNLTSLYAAGFKGAGQKIAVIDAPGDPDPQKALDTYSTRYGLPTTTLSILYPDCSDPHVSCYPPSAYDTSWASETAMDIESVHAVAPAASIVLLYCLNDTSAPLNCDDYVASNGLAAVASNSWSFCADLACATFSDANFTSAFLTSIDSRLAIDASLGLTILFASGDAGSKPNGPSGPLGVEFPASDPNVLAVGATNLGLTGCNATIGTCTGYGVESAAFISGGGYSAVFAEPSWQTSALGPRSGRAVPDVSMLGYSPGIWVYSTLSDECGTFAASGASNQWFSCTGTSLSTPLWAGVLALALQMSGGRSFGNIGPLLYQLASDPAKYHTIFHDITLGSNGNPSYHAQPGWDPATGWGTPIANNLTSAIAGTAASVNLAILSGFTGLSSGNVLLVVGDIQGNPHGPKPSGVGYQVGRDSTPLGVLSGMLVNAQPSKFDTNSAVVDSSGRPVGSWSIVFGVGGPDVDAVTHYYEFTGVLADRAPVTWSVSGGSWVWTDRNGVTVLSVPESSTAVPPGSSDVFVIQILKDSGGRLVVLMDGTSYMGTWAAAWYFKHVVYPSISSYTNSYYIVRWTDATSGADADFVPGAGDTFTVLKQGTP